MKKIFIVVLAIVLFGGCNRDKFLDVKPDDSLVIPTSLKDFQALLDNEEYMNGFKSGGPNPGLIFAGTDEYYFPDNLFNRYGQHVRNAYTWVNVNLFAGQATYNDWASPYRTVYYANVVLDGLKKLSPNSDAAAYNNAKGSALFYRAHAFYQLAQAFAQPYKLSSAKTDLGIPIRLVADVSETSPRASVEQTYAQIESDLKEALPLLPDQPLYNTRPSKPSVYALLARMNLGMENYDSALQYAGNCLTLHSDLLDYNTLSASASAPMPVELNNKEVIFTGTVQLTPLGSQLVNFNNCFIDSTLYPMYADGDLRKTVCFKNGSLPRSKQFKGSYTRTTAAFAGIATDEVFLIKAECQARKEDASGAMNTLNTLLKARWKTGLFTPLTASNADEALSIVLTERRKELLMRGTRWTDLKRLNRDGRFSKTIYRFVNGMQFTLPPNDPRYTWQIPDVVINLNPGMPQNPR